MARTADQEPGTSIVAFKDRFWHMRLLDGMSFTGWIRLLVRNRFAACPLAAWRWR